MSHYIVPPVPAILPEWRIPGLANSVEFPWGANRDLASLAFLVQFNGTPHGLPRVGIGINILPTSTPTNFTGHVLLYDGTDDKLKLVSYINQSLAGLGTVHAEVVVPIPVKGVQMGFYGYWYDPAYDPTLGHGGEFEIYAGFMGSFSLPSLPLFLTDIAYEQGSRAVASWQGIVVVGSDSENHQDYVDMKEFRRIQPDCDFVPGTSDLSITADGDMNCEAEQYAANLEVVGGTGPFMWSTTQGSIVSTGARTAQLQINTELLDEGTFGNMVAYFTVEITYNWQQANQQQCIDVDASKPYRSNATIDIILYAHRCDGTVIGSGDSLYNWQNNIGHDVIGDVHDMLLEYINLPISCWSPYTCYGGQNNHTDLDYIWAVCSYKCCPDGDPDSIQLTYNVYPAGLQGYSGVVWDGALPFSDVYNEFAITAEAEVVSVPDRGAIDVRTQAMISTNCSPCAAIEGGNVIVTVTDSLGNNFPLELIVG